MKPVEEIEAELVAEAEKTGYILNPDREMLEDIIEGLSINEERFGYWSCPCRIASGDHLSDLDIICPCEYRDADLEEYGRCYCSLYVTRDYIKAGMPSDPIPERRYGEEKVEAVEADVATEESQDQDIEISAEEVDEEMPANEVSSGIVVWRCRVCGYLCARTEPPRVCPICRAKRERFGRFSLSN